MTKLSSNHTDRKHHKRTLLFDALRRANDALEDDAGTYACNFWSPRPPIIQHVDGVELTGIALVDLTGTAILFYPDEQLDDDHHELADALAAGGWDVDVALRSERQWAEGSR